MAYAASVNPPRRAKRPRIDDLPAIAPAPASAPIPDASTVSHQDRTFVSDDDDEEEQALDDDDAVPPPKRRGRKPSTLSRAARESMRRQNHSRIEKARRTKINDALATLRQLVPAGDGDDDDYEHKKKGKQEKEFKLEVLERTVVYVQELQKRVRELEAVTAGPDPGASHKRKRDNDLDLTSEDRHSRTQSPVYLPPPPVAAVVSRRTSVSISPAARASDAASSQPSPLLLPSASSSSSPARPRLPSISAWLPAGIQPPSPSILPDRERMRIGAFQPQRSPLPTPPTSGSLGPVSGPSIPPALALELPASAVSPPWTPDDESAASLLLQIRGTSPRQPRVQTPASLLGMRVPKT
ncbi:hypothetical protein K488DRAFT_71338 [Vararia minispora EC-137]|uniref:Uncharacterized protein n=1 Tax=Vararia minispora EC-137 TaxID=1314806 RepID=A0ACB8QIS2_9AGAM|nr:hypothetical protein K488DRAFT_71338 [Vararia minispora EC-137]